MIAKRKIKIIPGSKIQNFKHLKFCTQEFCSQKPVYYFTISLVRKNELMENELDFFVPVCNKHEDILEDFLKLNRLSKEERKNLK